MASKRKKTRPTKCSQSGQSLEDGDDDRLDLQEDEAALLQRFINKSEDGMETCFDEIQQSPVKKIMGSIERVGYGITKQKTWTDFQPKSYAKQAKEEQFSELFGYEQFLSSVKSHLLNGENTGDRTHEESISEDPSTNVLDCSSVLFQLVHEELKSRMNGKVSSPNSLTNGLIDVEKTPSKRTRVTKNEDSRYTCSVCKYMTKRSDHYKRHLITHTTDKPLKCTLCDYNTGRSDHYKRHLHRHGLSEKEVNDQCTKNGVKLKFNVGSQDKIILSQPDRQCRECKKIFIDHDAMLTHWSKEHPTLPKLSKKCTNSKTDATSLEPSPKKKHNCENCGYSTNVKYHMERHKKVHSKEPNTYCRECQKSYKYNGYLQQHRCKSNTCTGGIRDKMFVDNEAFTELTTTKHELTNESSQDIKIDNTSDNDRVKETRINVTQDVTGRENQTQASNIQENDNNVDTSVSEPVSERDVEIGCAPGNVCLNLFDETSKNRTENVAGNHEAIFQSNTQKNVTDFVEATGSKTSIERDVELRHASDMTSLKENYDANLHSATAFYVDSANDSDQHPGFVPKMLSENEYSALGNLRCTKCGEWFIKLQEYSLHSCVL